MRATKPLITLVLLIALAAWSGLAAPVLAGVPVARDAAESADRLKRALAGGPAILRDFARAESGVIFHGAVSTPAPGRYRLHVPVAVHPLGTLETFGLVIKVRAGATEQSFNSLSFPESDGFVDLATTFVAEAGPTAVEVSWKFDGKGATKARAKSAATPKMEESVGLDEKPRGGGFEDMELDPDAAQPMERAKLIASCLMLREPHAERLSPVAVEAVVADKITYKRGEKGHATVRLRNFGGAPKAVTLNVDVRSGLDRVAQARSEQVTVPPGGVATWQGTFDTGDLAWGGSVRAVAELSGFAAESGQAFFAAPDHFWDVAIMATCPAQMTREFTSMDRARQAAAQLKAAGYTGFEAYFWAPCDLLDYTPKTERFISGQTAYVQSVTGTRNLIAACHELGIVATFYANLWGGSGQPAFEVMRRHPEWFGSASFHSGALDDVPLMTAGILRGPGQKVWSFNQLNDKSGMGLFDFHTDQILGAIKMFGWDGIRYDSYYSAEWTIKAMTKIRERMRKEAPSFLFGYNAFADAEYKVGAMDSIAGGMIMAEGLRVGHGSKLGDFLNALESWRSLSWPYGSAVGPIYGFTSGDDKAPPPTPLDHVFLTSAILAAGGHPYYNPIENALGRHADFALRYAEFLFNTRMRHPLDPDAVVKWQDGVDPLAWRPLLRTLSLGGGRHRLVMQVLNIPRDHVLGSLSMKTMPPMTDTRVTFKLPPGAKATGAWLLRAVPEANHQSLALSPTADGVGVALTGLRHYGVVVLEFESETPIPEKVDAKAAREKAQTTPQGGGK